MTNLSRRRFLSGVGAAVVATAVSATPSCAHAVRGQSARVRRPNVVLILADDQGYGDLGCHGNPYIVTPNLNWLYSESVRFTQFHVSPVCTPTRASLMTGRYNFRTGAIDTYLGRAMMHRDEATMAELWRDAGYRTGIFGKWHLGDHYPMRAMDQGFEESLVHRGGGLAQPSCPPGNTYFNPILAHNGADRHFQGYCTDIFASAALRFIEANCERPFFVYLATNAPHAPLQVDESYVLPYIRRGLDQPVAKAYGMITNLDENVGRVLAKLTELRLEEDTIVIFMTDNGAAIQTPRYNAGMRGAKGTVYEGGIRVPCFIRWPGHLSTGKDIDRLAAHIDLLPTLLDLCGLSRPDKVALDGRSLAPLVRGSAVNWPDRTLCFQWHRGDSPELYNNCAARTQRFKLVNGRELYDLEAHPGEEHDLAGQQPDLVVQLRGDYEAWFEDVCSTRGFAPMRVPLGSPHENPVVLTRQDWRGAKGWNDNHVGYWEVTVAKAGRYDILLEFSPVSEPSQIRFQLGGVERTRAVQAGESAWRLTREVLPKGDAQLRAAVQVNGAEGGMRYVTVTRT